MQRQAQRHRDHAQHFLEIARYFLVDAQMSVHFVQAFQPVAQRSHLAVLLYRLVVLQRLFHLKLRVTFSADQQVDLLLPLHTV